MVNQSNLNYWNNRIRPTKKGLENQKRIYSANGKSQHEQDKQIKILTKKVILQEKLISKLKLKVSVLTDNPDNIDKPVPRTKNNVVEIVKIYCSDVTGCSWQEIIGIGRSSEQAWARQVIYAILYKYSALSQSEIARRLNRDHSTIGYGVSLVKSVIANDQGGTCKNKVSKKKAAVMLSQCQKWANIIEKETIDNGNSVIHTHDNS